MNKNSDIDSSLDNYISQQIYDTLKTNKLTLINENIIKTLELENREKIIISEARKIFKKQKVDFFYLDEIIKRIASKYKLKEEPRKYLISLFQKGVIIVYKREPNFIFSNPPLVNTSEISVDSEKSDNKSKLYEEHEKLSKKIAKDLNIDRMGPDIESLEKEVNVPKQTNGQIKDNNLKPDIKVDNTLQKNTEKQSITIEKPVQDKTSIDSIKIPANLLLNENTIETKIEPEKEKKILSEEEKRVLLIARKEMVDKIQSLLNNFEFLDAIAELEEVIDISKKLNDKKAVELYTKQSEMILQTGLKYENIIDSIKANPQYRKKVEDMLNTTVNQIKKFWKNKEYQNVYNNLRKAAKLSYYLENIKDAITYNEQAEAIRSKLK
ncbi:MAG: hypothetical protein ACTSQO_05150 [Candidatus Helarchaeota archaeon]